MKKVLSLFFITAALYCPTIYDSTDSSIFIKFLNEKRKYENVLGRIQKGEKLEEALKSQELTKDDWDRRELFGIKE